MSEKILVKTVQLAIGVDLLGSAMSLSSSRGSTLEMTPIGIKAVGKSGRIVVIPYSNVRGFELFGEEKDEPKKTGVKK